MCHDLGAFISQKITCRVSVSVSSKVDINFGESFEINNSLGYRARSNFMYVIKILNFCHNFRLYGP